MCRFIFFSAGPKDWLREQKKKSANFLLAPIDGSRNILRAAYLLLGTSLTLYMHIRTPRAANEPRASRALKCWSSVLARARLTLKLSSSSAYSQVELELGSFSTEVFKHGWFSRRAATNEPQLVLTNRVKTNLSLARLVNILGTRAPIVC